MSLIVVRALELDIEHSRVATLLNTYQMLLTAMIRGA
jgi:hypothetical protein